MLKVFLHLTNKDDETDMGLVNAESQLEPCGLRDAETPIPEYSGVSIRLPLCTS